MTKKEVDKRCQIEVDMKASGITRISVVATTEEKALKLFKQVREEIDKDEG